MKNAKCKMQNGNSVIKGTYAIIDNIHYPNLTPFELAEKYLKNGIKLIQLRQKGRASVETRQCLVSTSYNITSSLRQYAQQILLLKKEYDFTFIINDDPYLAKKVNADGVHLGQEDMSVEDARKILGKEKIIGLSTYSLDQIRQAQKLDVTYIGFGAIFKSPTKNNPDHPVVGLDLLKQAVRISKIPVVAIGGIHQSNIQQVWDTGVHAVAMISGL